MKEKNLSVQVETMQLQWNLSNFEVPLELPYKRHHNLLLITNRSWVLTIHKARIFWKNLLENKEMVFKNGVKSIQVAGYNGPCTVQDQCLIGLVRANLTSFQANLTGLTQILGQIQKTDEIGSGWPQKGSKFRFNPIMYIVLNKPELTRFEPNFWSDWTQIWVGLQKNWVNLGRVDHTKITYN